jgi:hypothetical protein
MSAFAMSFLQNLPSAIQHHSSSSAAAPTELPMLGCMLQPLTVHASPFVDSISVLFQYTHAALWLLLLCS